MIVPMKKLSLLLYHKEKESFLNSLQDLGVVHVAVNAKIQSENLSELQEKVKIADRVLKALKRVKTPSVTQQKKGNAEEIINQYGTLASQREEIEQQIIKLRKDAAALEPWGNFDPASLGKLKEKGVSIRFFRLHEKMFGAMKKDDLYFEVINRKEGSVYFVVLVYGESVLPDIEDVILPQVSLETTLKEIKALANKKQKIEKSIEELAAYQDVLTFYLSNQNCHLSLESARINMEEGADGRVLSLTGWLPVNKEKKVTEFLNGFFAWFECSDPLEDDDVPILLKNKKGFALFEAITKIFNLPDYFELDPTPFFAPFFAFFFGLCLGDCGYGLIVLIGSLVALKKGPASLKPIFQLGMILGIATMVAGLFLNTFFGAAVFSFPGFEEAIFKTGGRIGAPLGAFEAERGKIFPAMTFALYIGIMQIILGMILRGFNRIQSSGMIFGIAPLSNILMVGAFVIFLAHANFMEMGTFSFWAVPAGKLLSSVPASVAKGLAVAGVGLLLFFNDPRKKLPARVGIGLWELYNFVSGVVSNGLSYLRLFALGLAGGLLGAAFNEIAFMLITDANGVVNYASVMTIFTVLILIASHTLNLGLSALGAFVHSLRLTFVEFYGNVNFKGGGKAYSPLSKFR